MELTLNDSPELRAELTALLKNGLVTVSFVKVDGERRDMPCTLKEDFIPVDKLPKNSTATKTSTETAKVFVTDIQQWRSFRWDSIIAYS